MRVRLVFSSGAVPFTCEGGRRQDRRDEVGEALADPGARFDDEVRLIGNGLPRDGLRHLQLLGPLLVTLEPLRNPPLHGPRMEAVSSWVVIKQRRRGIPPRSWGQ